MPRFDDDYLWAPVPWGFGSAHSISGDGEPEDVVEQLRQVVEEVTGQSLDRPAKKIGFY